MLRKKLSLLVAGLIVGGAMCGGASAQNQSSIQVIQIDGYPLDRTLEGLANYPKLDAVLLLSAVKLGEPHWTTPDGAPPGYVTQNRPPNLEEFRRNDLIVTPVTATISQVLRGLRFSPGEELTFEVAGGRVGTVEVRADEEIAPNLDQLTRGGRILLAGEVRGSIIVPSFIYRLEADGNNVKSLLKSASDKEPGFGIADLRRALVLKP